MTIYEKLKAADPQATAHLLEITGHMFGPHPGELAAWRRRIGVLEAEFNQVVREYRTRIDQGVHPAHPEQF